MEIPCFDSIFPLNDAAVRSRHEAFVTDIEGVVARERDIIASQLDPTALALESEADFFSDEGAIYYKLGLTWAHYMLREAHNDCGYVISFLEDEESCGVMVAMSSLGTLEPEELAAEIDVRIRNKDEALASAFSDLRALVGSDIAKQTYLGIGALLLISKCVGKLEANSLPRDFR